MILKLKRTPGLYLVGFMGSGKTTVGELVAYELGWTFADVDRDIEAREQMTIPQIFDTRGEAEFRRIEAEMVGKRVHMVQRGRPTVVALGGGAFANEDNYELLEENGVSVWLECPLEVARQRIEGMENRPLARDPRKFEELFELRQSSYARADFRVDGSQDPATVCKAILRLPIF